MTAQAIGQYGYSKRLRGGDRKRFRVDVFGMEVTQVLDLWPEVHQRKRQWLSPAEAAVRVSEPELAMVIRTFARDQLGQAGANANMLSSNLAEVKSLASHLRPAMI